MRPTSFPAPTLCLALLALASTAAAQPCKPTWTQYPHRGVNSYVWASAEYDFDGPGPRPPQLVIGGDFTRIGPQIAQGLAIWDGSAWEPISIPGLTYARVRALAVFDEDGSGPIPPKLAAGGAFVHDGTVYGLAIFDQQGWTFTSAAVTVRGLAGLSAPGPFGSSLFLADSQGIARYSGGGGGAIVSVVSAPFQMEAVAVYDPDAAGPQPPNIYAAGHFNTVGGAAASGIARFDGAAWHALGSGVDQGRVWTMHVHDPDGPGPQLPILAVAGDFLGAGGFPSVAVAAWNGSNWINYPGLYGAMSALATVDLDGPGPQLPSLIAAGSGGTESPVYNGGVLRWSGSAWVPFTNGLNHYSYALQEFYEDGPGPAPARLFAGGVFTSSDSAPFNHTPHVARLEAGAWSPMGAVGNPTVNYLIRAMVVHDEDGDGPLPPYLALAGRFALAGSTPANRIAKWDGNSFQPLGSHTNIADTLFSFDPDGPGPEAPWLLAGGDIRRWTGSSWAFMTGAIGFRANHFVQFDPDGPGPAPESLYAVGRGSGSGSPMLRLNQTAWTQVTGVPAGSWEIYSAVAFDPDGPGPQPNSLIVAGRFQTSGANSLRNIARWDGTAWHPMGSGMDREVQALAIFDEDGPGGAPPRLFAGGAFYTSGGVQTNGLARWDGLNWSRVGPATAGLNFVSVYDLTVFDEDGEGPAGPELFVGGNFVVPAAPGQASGYGVVKWNGQDWRSLGAGLDSYPYSMAAFDADGPGPAPAALYFGGMFRNAGGEPSLFFASWGCQQGACYANCDDSTHAPILNVVDFACFLTSFAAGEPYANCDQSTTPPVINIADFTCFLQKFAAGCP